MPTIDLPAVETVNTGYADKAILHAYNSDLVQAILLNFAGWFGLRYLVGEAYLLNDNLIKILPEDVKKQRTVDLRFYAIRKVPVKVGKKTILEMVR